MARLLKRLMCASTLFVASPASAHEFVVWFEKGRAEVPPSYAQVVIDAACWARLPGMERVHVVGHADTSEPADDELSKRRAQAVADAFLALGVPRERMAVAWRGKMHPVVPNPGPGGEPLNRRVTIQHSGRPTGPVDCGPKLTPRLST